MMSEGESMSKVCGRCGHSWISVKDMPARCPSCGTYHWYGESRTNTCLSCGHIWFSRTGRVPLRCPKCKTRSWASGASRGRRNYMTFDDELSKRIIDLYMAGEGCVHIAMRTDTALSHVIETIRCGVCDGRSPRM